MLQRVVTSLNKDSSELLIELHEQLNPFVAASFIGAAAGKCEVHADEGGMLYITTSVGGADVKTKRDELEKDDTVDENGAPKPVDEKTKPEDRPKNPKQKLEQAFADDKKKVADEKKAAADKAAAAKPAAPPPPASLTAHELAISGASKKDVEVPPEDATKKEDPKEDPKKEPAKKDEPPKPDKGDKEEEDDKPAAGAHRGAPQHSRR